MLQKARNCKPPYQPIKQNTKINKYNVLYIHENRCSLLKNYSALLLAIIRFKKQQRIEITFFRNNTNCFFVTGMQQVALIQAYTNVCFLKTNTES